MSFSVQIDAREFEAVLKDIPPKVVKEFGSALKDIHRAHRHAVRDRSSMKTPEGNRRLSLAVYTRIKAKPGEGRELSGESFMLWKGIGRTASDAVAAEMEKQVGKKVIKPQKSKYLAVPAGGLLTPQGRPRRSKGKALLVSEQPNTFLLKVGGRLLIMQRRGRGASDAEGWSRSIQEGKARGQAVRLVGILLLQVERKHFLDFFGSWDAIEPFRAKRLDEALTRSLIG